MAKYILNLYNRFKLNRYIKKNKKYLQEYEELLKITPDASKFGIELIITNIKKHIKQLEDQLNTNE